MLCEIYGTEVVIINRSEDSTFEEDLAQDVLEIITVFSARLYGTRSNKNLEAVATELKAAYGVKIHLLEMDVSDRAMVETSLASIQALFSKHFRNIIPVKTFLVKY